MRLVTALIDRHRNRPAVIIGGAPSAPDDFRKVTAIAPVVISANDHAFRLLGAGAAQYVVAKDHRHTQTKELMEDRLRPYGTPIIGPNWWADYRWPTGWIQDANSGMHAIAVAALMGCHPIIPIGFECYQGGTHFGDVDAENCSKGRALEADLKRLRTIKHDWLPDVAVRPVSGPLTNIWPAYDRGELFLQREGAYDIARRLGQMTEYRFAVEPGTVPFGGGEPISRPATIAVSRWEMMQAADAGLVDWPPDMPYESPQRRQTKLLAIIGSGGKVPADKDVRFQ